MSDSENKTEIELLTEKVKLVAEKYKEEYPDTKIDRDYFPFKLTEEWGECMQTYLMLTDRGRQKGKSKEEIHELFSREIADVFGYLLLFANNEGIDIKEALNKKWFVYLDNSDK
jgi:NTP pyrophosphatase (non-canonical NTP hydrolase)